MKKKVLVLTSTFPRWKGDTNPPFVFELSRRLTDKFDVTVLTPYFPGSKSTETMDNLKVHRFHYFFEKFERLGGNGGILPTLKANKFYYSVIPFFIFFEIISTLKIVKKIKPDVLHAHWIIPQGLTAYVNYLVNKTPYVITSHGGDIFGLQNKFLIKLKKIVLQKAKSITVVSSAIKKEIINIDPNLVSKIEVIPMGVDSRLFNPDKYDETIKKKYDITGSFLLFVGRLAEKKGVRYLIEAMPAVLKKFPKAKLLIVGSGPLELDLKKLTNKLHLSSSIVFTGAIQNSDLPKFYATADIFIGPSIVADDGDREGLPVTFMEAIACGCPVIATDLFGNRDIINELNGYLIRQKDGQDIVTKVILGLKNKWNKNMIANFIKRNYSWEIIVNKYLHELS